MRTKAGRHGAAQLSSISAAARLPAAPFAITRSRSMSSASAWAKRPPGCTNGSIVSVLRWIGPRSAVNSPTSRSTASSHGRRRRIGMRFCSRAHRGEHYFNSCGPTGTECSEFWAEGHVIDDRYPPPHIARLGALYEFQRRVPRRPHST